MVKWGRDTSWRQGQLLESETVERLGLASSAMEERIAVVVITHDCDLAQSVQVEPCVEVIVGRFVDAVDGSYAYCKNLRRLHIESTDGSSVSVIELESSKRISLNKENSTDTDLGLCNHQPSSMRIVGRDRDTLQYWLSARYKRAAFPDEFDRRLKATGAYDRLSKAFRDSGKHIPAVFFDVDCGVELTREGPDDLYELTITLLYSGSVDPDAAERAAEQAKACILEVFRTRCEVKRDGISVCQWIELRDVEVLSEYALSYAQSRELKKWQADHISLREDPAQPMLED